MQLPDPIKNRPLVSLTVAVALLLAIAYAAVDLWGPEKSGEWVDRILDHKLQGAPK